MEKKKLLLHSCCAPCSTAVIERLVDDFDITVFYYNPNIYPKEEYEKRKNEQKRYIKLLNSGKNIEIKMLDADYNPIAYYGAVKGLQNEKEGGARCARCFKLRLKRTAMAAKEHGMDIFATTLTVSPHKNSKVINEIGNQIAAEVGIPFLESDFKKQDGYKRSIDLSKENNLYRQNYCGCKFALNQMNRENK